MSKITETFTNILKIQELRERLFFTSALLIIVRIGSHVTLPGVDASLLADTIRRSSEGTLFGLYDLFVGGAFSNASVFALGIMPYISASIVIQLLGVAVPYFQKLQKEGESGRRRLNQITRFLTVLITLAQAPGYIASQIPDNAIFGGPSALFSITSVILLTTGTIFVMWVGEKITD